jgi:uncharacterized protein
MEAVMRFCSRISNRLLPAVILAGGLAVLGPARADGPSYDCGKASSPAERAICADPQLSAIDALIAKAFKDFEPAFGGDKRKIARALVADRDACKDEIACIVSAQNNALQTFGFSPHWVEAYNEGLIGKKALDTGAREPKGANQPLPAAIGQCAVTHIATLTTRFGDDPLATASADGGAAATFVNGGSAVSYERDPGLAASTVGDPAVLCLMSIPRDCPEGDLRGRVYYGVDLNFESAWWVLPDSEHLCGGA